MIEKTNLQQTLDRWLAYVERRMEDGILATIGYPARAASGSSGDLEPAKVCGCLAIENPEGCLSREEDSVRSFRNSLTDDFPCAYPTLHFGESVWAGFFGGDITFSGTDSHTWSFCKEPPLRDVTEFDFAPLDEDNYWYKKMLEVTDYYVKNLEPVCDMREFIFIDCLNLLVELRGASTAFTDLYDYPDFVTRFMDWSVEVNIQIYEAQARLLRDFTDKAFGGHPFSRYSASRIPDLSVDANGMCSADMYRRWGLEQHKRIISHYGGGRLHIHGNGRHLCELVSQIENLTYCSMGDDKGYPKACEIVKELKDRMSPIPISVSIPREQFLDSLHNRSLPGGVLYFVQGNSLQDTNEIMLRVFDYSTAR